MLKRIPLAMLAVFSVISVSYADSSVNALSTDMQFHKTLTVKIINESNKTLYFDHSSLYNLNFHLNRYIVHPGQSTVFYGNIPGPDTYQGISLQLPIGIMTGHNVVIYYKTGFLIFDPMKEAVRYPMFQLATNNFDHLKSLVVNMVENPISSKYALQVSSATVEITSPEVNG